MTLQDPGPALLPPRPASNDPCSTARFHIPPLCHTDPWKDAHHGKQRGLAQVIDTWVDRREVASRSKLLLDAAYHADLPGRRVALRASLGRRPPVRVPALARRIGAATLDAAQTRGAA